MMIFTLLGIIVAIFFFVVILMTIIEGRIKRKNKEKLLWKMDKVVTRTEGLKNNILNEKR